VKKITLIPVLIVLMALPAVASDFLTSARGSGMGLSYFILADDPSGALYNPSSLGFTRGWQTQLTYDRQNRYQFLNWEENPYAAQFAAVYSSENIGGFGLNVLQSGSFTSQSSITTVNRIVASYGRELMPGWAAGTSLKYMNETTFAKRSAFDMDLGIIYRFQPGIVAALSAENILRAKLSPDYFGITEYLPRRERLGLGYLHDSDSWQGALLLAGQLEESGISEKYTTTLMNIGTEWWLWPYSQFSLGLRSGYTFGKGVEADQENDYSGFGAGFSINYKIGSDNLRFDYGLSTYPYETSYGSTPVDHYVAMTFGWGGVPDYSSRTEEQYREPMPVRVQEPAEPEIYNPPSESENQPPDIDRDTDFEARQYEKYDVDMDVSDISSMAFKRIVFYLRPQTIIQTTNWKLYIFKAKLANWEETDIDRWALKIVEGKGLPPINVVWDGKAGDGRLLPPGKYYCILTAQDSDGQNYATGWHKFNME
jgi:hypothetical protein